MDLIEIPVHDGTAEAYVARPASGTGPGVLLFIDAIGLRPQIARMADRMAGWGFVVLAPNVFWREGTAQETSPTGDLREPGAREAFMGEAMGRVGRLTSDLAEPDIDAYLEALRGLDGVTGDEVGVVGYCMGARLAVRAASRHPESVAAVGGFHGGGLVTGEPDSPHLGLPRAKAEFVLGHADNDRSMTPDMVAALGKALEDAGLTGSNEIYPDAPHGYSMADTSMYQEAGAERSFAELEELYRRVLG